MSRRAKGEIVLPEVDDHFWVPFTKIWHLQTGIQNLCRSEEIANWQLLCSKYLAVYPVGVSGDPYQYRIFRSVNIFA